MVLKDWNGLRIFHEFRQQLRKASTLPEGNGNYLNNIESMDKDYTILLSFF